MLKSFTLCVCVSADLSWCCDPPPHSIQLSLSAPSLPVAGSVPSPQTVKLTFTPQERKGDKEAMFELRCLWTEWINHISTINLNGPVCLDKGLTKMKNRNASPLCGHVSVGNVRQGSPLLFSLLKTILQ